MQQIVIEKPYEFIAPHRGTWWPWCIQQLRLVDKHLRKNYGVESFECRNSHRLNDSLAAGHGILLTPNHCRPCDGLVMGLLARRVRCNLFAMASWHLFHQDWFTAWAIPKMGGFSLYREGIDRRAINEAVGILETAERPLVLFPEGAVYRTNDQLQALLDGVAFIARSAAKRRARSTPGGKVVIHPVAIKYFFQGELRAAVEPVLTDIEHRLTWRPQDKLPLAERMTKVGLGLLALKEIEFCGRAQIQKFELRLAMLIDHLLDPLEDEWFGRRQDDEVVPRVKNLRMKIMPDMVRGEVGPQERSRRWTQLEDIYLAQQVASYPPDYLTERPSIDRLLETVERFEENLTDQVRTHGSLKCVLDVGEAIEVGVKRDRQADEDPLMVQIGSDLQGMLDELAKESPTWEE